MGEKFCFGEQSWLPWGHGLLRLSCGGISLAWFFFWFSGIEANFQKTTSSSSGWVVDWPDTRNAWGWYRWSTWSVMRWWRQFSERGLNFGSRAGCGELKASRWIAVIALTAASVITRQETLVPVEAILMKCQFLEEQDFSHSPHLSMPTSMSVAEWPGRPKCLASDTDLRNRASIIPFRLAYTVNKKEFVQTTH